MSVSQDSRSRDNSLTIAQGTMKSNWNEIVSSTPMNLRSPLPSSSLSFFLVSRVIMWSCKPNLGLKKKGHFCYVNSAIDWTRSKGHPGLVLHSLGLAQQIWKVIMALEFYVGASSQPRLHWEISMCMLRCRSCTWNLPIPSWVPQVMCLVCLAGDICLPNTSRCLYWIKLMKY